LAARHIDVKPPTLASVSVSLSNPCKCTWINTLNVISNVDGLAIYRNR